MSAATETLAAELKRLQNRLQFISENVTRTEDLFRQAQRDLSTTRARIGEIEAALRLLSPFREQVRAPKVARHIKIVSGDEPPPEAV